ncbi:MAG: protein translocase subunit SecD [Spirochaetales bacterium]|nr:protein translocase subunit SecD [Spirochaetales bacterium]
MKKMTRFLILIVFLVGVCGFYFLKPTVEWYFFTDKEIKDSAQQSRELIRDDVLKKAEASWVRFNELASETPDSIIDAEFKCLLPSVKKNYKRLGLDKPSEWTYRAVQLGYVNDKNEAKKFIIDVFKAEYSKEILAAKEVSGRVLQLGLDLSGGISSLLQLDIDAFVADLEAKGEKPKSANELNFLIDEAVDATISSLRDRVDQFGVGEVSIKRYGDDRLMIDLPGVQDPDRINTFVKGAGILEFRIVDEENTSAMLAWLSENPEKSYKDYELPAGSQAYGIYKEDVFGLDELTGAIVLKISEPAVLGTSVQNVSVATDERDGKPIVNFSLNKTGADVMSMITEKYQPAKNDQGQTISTTRLAIVLSDRVKSAPAIQSKLSTGITVSGFGQKEAFDLAKILRTGSFKIPISVISQQKVGAQLAEDQLNSGIWALIIGGIAVFLFMILYYLRGGVVAVIAMFVNMFMLISILAGMGMTLTLPSIAGLILTIGMAVDANVIIFERIKEEYMIGKSPRAAINAGFKKAFWTIIDANVTTFIAAVALTVFGTSIVKGFANTLALGIVTSMVAALFVSRLMFDFSLDVLKPKKLVLGWRRRNEG